MPFYNEPTQLDDDDDPSYLRVMELVPSGPDDSSLDDDQSLDIKVSAAIETRLANIEAAIARIETNSNMITELVKDFSTTISKLQLNPMLAKMFGLNKQPKE